MEPVEKPLLEERSYAIRRLEEAAHKVYDMDAVNNAHAIREAEEHNLRIVYPKANELQIDIDDEESLHVFYAMAPLIDKWFGIQSHEITTSRSGLPNRHVTVELRNPVPNDWARIALQVIMGSDRIREVLGAVRVSRGEEHPTLFLEKQS